MREPKLKLQQSPLKEVSLCRALYSNTSEYPNELSFKKGDLLRVLSEKPEIEGACTEGWWLCADKTGKKGIAPANRLEVMQRFDQGFFQVAAPFMDDFFAFHSTPFDDPFFRDRPSFASSLRERLAPASLRRMNSCDDALRGSDGGGGGVGANGVVRNIPIRVERPDRSQSTFDVAAVPEPPRRFSETPAQIRRTMSSGRVSPPPPPAPTRGSQLSLHTNGSNFSTSFEPDERSLGQPVRTLVIPSSIPGRSIEIPLGDSMAPPQQQMQKDRSKSPRPESQIDKLAQRLKHFASKPFRSSSQQQLSPTSADLKDERSPSPSSSGIGADATDSDENKRTSDLSSLSSASEQNSLHSEQSDEHRSRQVPIQRPSPSFPSNPPVSILDTIQRPPLKKFGNNLPTVTARDVEEDMRRNDILPWRRIPVKIPQENVEDSLEETVWRKRVVENRLSDSLRMIENSVRIIDKATAAQHWRVAYVLQSNIAALRDAVTTVDEHLQHFIDGTARISIDRSSPKAVELNGLLMPLTNASATSSRLRRILEEGGWSVATLARDREKARVNDALEQYIQLAKQVPNDCRQVVHWVQKLVPSSTVVFLPPAPARQSSAVERPSNLLNAQTVEEKRLSSSSTSSTAASTETPPSSILITKPSEKPKGRVTFADENRDRSSTGSSIDQSSVEYASIQKPKVLTPIVAESKILEEDDLESVVSDNIFQDYAYLDDVVPGRSTPPTPTATEPLDEEDRQLIKFYQPQLEQHTDSLSQAIEELLATVEKNLPPREFVQKSKLIILAAHKLIYIGDTVSQCLHSTTVGLSLRDKADQLCELLKDCVRTTRQAADEYPDIASMQAMVDNILEMSRSAHQLKLSMKQLTN